MKILRSVGSFLYTLMIFAGLPLLGWGWDHAISFFSNPPLLAYLFSIAAYGLLASYMIQRPGGMGNTLGKGQEDKFNSRQRIVRVVFTGLLLGGLFFVPFADQRGLAVMDDYPAVRWVGLFLANLGMGLIFGSSWALGRLYSPDVTLQDGHHLITYGIYRFIRNPRYLGGIIQGIGLSLLFRSWIGLVLTFIFLSGVLFRIKDEEILMHQAFGAEWETYCKHSWRLVPYVY